MDVRAPADGVEVSSACVAEPNIQRELSKPTRKGRPPLHTIVRTRHLARRLDLGGLPPARPTALFCAALAPQTHPRLPRPKPVAPYRFTWHGDINSIVFQKYNYSKIVIKLLTHIYFQRFDGSGVRQPPLGPRMSPDHTKLEGFGPWLAREYINLIIVRISKSSRGHEERWGLCGPTPDHRPQGSSNTMVFQMVLAQILALSPSFDDLKARPEGLFLWLFFA
jgi:hypothetical protein